MNEIHEKIHSYGIDTIQENVYTFENEQVKNWTESFHSEVEKRSIFKEINKCLKNPSIEVASVIGACWYEFSNFMPWYLTYACSKASNNRLRHYIIQTAFEELGMRNSEEIHAEMFLKCAIDSNKDLSGNLKLILSSSESSKVLNKLKEALIESQSDEEILGQMLALEIPAEENIETTFNGLSYNLEAKYFLESTKFFKIHRAIEIEHVRSNIANFLRFCDTSEKKERFLKGFGIGLTFWKDFWDEVSLTINRYKNGQYLQ